MGTFLTKGTTFITGDTVTASGLNNLVDNSTITAGSISSTELGADSVINGKIIDSATGSEPVTTGTIRDNAISNAKLAQMANQTVKANNATAGAADPSDLEVAANKLMAGTSNSLSALSFTTDLEMADASDVVATDNTATKIRAANSLIDGKSTVTVAPTTDTVLVYDADGSGNTKLGKATVKSLVQSQVADTSTSGVTRLALASRLVNSSGADVADVPYVTDVSPMLAKAYGYILTLTNAIVGASSILQNCTVTRTGEGAFTVAFVTNLPSANYIVLGNGREELSSAGDPYGYGLQVVSSSLATTGFNFVTVDTSGDAGTLLDPDGGMQFIVFGLTS